MDPPPPPYKAQMSMTRTRNAPGNVQEMAESMLRASITRNGPVSPTTAVEPTSSHEDPSSEKEALAKGESALSDISPGTSLPVSPTEPLFVNTTGNSTSSIPSPTDASPPPSSPASPERRRSSVVSSGYLPIMGSARPAKNKNSSSSLERLRQVEQENEELRRQIQREQAQNEQLRRDTQRTSFVSNKEAKLRVAQLKTEAKAEAAKVTPSPNSLAPKMNLDLFKQTVSTDLLFLIDCTHSMRPSIDNVKKNVKNIVNTVRQSLYGESRIRVSIVAYRDHGCDKVVESLDFIEDTAVVFKFLDGLKTEYGHDIPEDVLGGINGALKMSWDQPTRCLIHIGDAPPHGHIFADSTVQDRYPEPGSEPHGLLYKPLFQLMHRKNINYFFLPINKYTDRMAYVFASAYVEESADVRLNDGNRYAPELKNMIELRQKNQQSETSKGAAQGKLAFVVAELGSVHTLLQKLVVKSVLSSASRTATRTASRVSEAVMGDTAGKTVTRASNLGDIDENEPDSEKPLWEKRAWFDETIEMEGFSPDAFVHGARTLDNLMESDDKMKMSVTDVTVQKRAKPFAAGSTRFAFYGRTLHSTNPIVVKTFKRGGKSLAHLVEEMRCQTLCKAFALEFNSLVSKEYAIDFVVTTSLKGKSSSDVRDERLSLEPFIQGEYVKYNNNCGYVNEDTDKNHWTNLGAQAFSHFTFERSRGQFLISDLQGVGNLLTDPAVHTKDVLRYQLTDTNLGVDGFKFFFATHECNAVCRTLQLKSKASMLLSGSIQFRDKWPTVESTVCCSNKLCGRIVNLQSAKTSVNHPGFYWCETCYPQLEETKVRYACIGQGPYHTYQVSAFFYESQGRLIPKTCYTHRTRDEVVRRPSLTDDKGGLLKKLSFWNKG